MTLTSHHFSSFRLEYFFRDTAFVNIGAANGVHTWSLACNDFNFLFAQGSLLAAKKTNPYPMELSAPIRANKSIGLLAGFLSIEEYRREANRKLQLLLDHYEISIKDPLKWQKLSFLLAVMHVPGFRLQRLNKKHGRPRIRSLNDDIEFIRLIDSFNLPGKKIPLKDRIRKAQKTERWRWPKLNARSFENRYYEAINRVADEVKIRQLLSSQPYPFAPLPKRLKTAVERQKASGRGPSRI